MVYNILEEKKWKFRQDRRYNSWEDMYLGRGLESWATGFVRKLWTHMSWTQVKSYDPSSQSTIRCFWEKRWGFTLCRQRSFNIVVSLPWLLGSSAVNLWLFYNSADPSVSSLKSFLNDTGYLGYTWWRPDFVCNSSFLEVGVLMQPKVALFLKKQMTPLGQI